MNALSESVELAEKGLRTLDLVETRLTRLLQRLLAGNYLTFYLDDQWCGIRLPHVRQVLPASEIFHLNQRPENVRGVILAANRFIPVVDLRSNFEARAVLDSANARVVLLQFDLPDGNDLGIGLLVDGMPLVTTFSLNEVSPASTVPGSVREPALQKFVLGSAHQNGRRAILLAVNKIAPASLQADLAKKIAKLGEPPTAWSRFNSIRRQDNDPAN